MKNNTVSVFQYFRKEKKLLALTAVTGLVYNIGMTAGPWFEGQLAQYLNDILRGNRRASDIVSMALAYVAVICVVQGARALKRLYVRKFANNVSRSMKESIYHHLVHESYASLHEEDAGSVMTRAISDADACAEGMRKFTTEIFDTGVVMIAYLVMLFVYDWRLTCIVILFPPIAYVVSGALKKRVSESAAESRKAMAELNGTAVDLVGNALTYRIYGEEKNREKAYEKVLDVYEQKNITAGIWQNSPEPVYLVISMIGVMPILHFGARNVLHTGWIVWTIASFTAYLSCFTKLASKSSHAARLFNAVQKAEVSWRRIRDYLGGEDASPCIETAEPGELDMEHVSFQYDEKGFGLQDLNLKAEPGEIIGITGTVASGKSTFGRLFLNELPYHGVIRYDGKDIRETEQMIFAWSGHDHELFTGSVEENITYGRKDPKRLAEVLEEVCLQGEVDPETMAGQEGAQLSGGQQARIALARALYTKAPVLILDDPFSSVDQNTENKIFASLREKESWRTILLISHRMDLFPKMDQIVFLEEGKMKAADHEAMMRDSAYARLYEMQKEGGLK